MKWRKRERKEESENVFPVACTDLWAPVFAQCLVKLCGTHLTAAEVAVFTVSGIDWYNYAIMKLYPASLSHRAGS